MNNFLIYRSSAGSGKTYTLVKEYLKLVLNDPESFKNVLAVTFTNKSAAEMKSRIISALIKLGAGADDDLKNKLIKEGVKGNIEIQAHQVLLNILHKYSYFSVTTIDSFFHKIVRSFARELKLQLGYNIELDEDAVLSEITDKLLDDTGVNDELTKFIEGYVIYSIDDKKGWNIDLKIKSIAKEIFRERFRLKAGINYEKLTDKTRLDEFISKLFAIKNEFEGEMKQLAVDADVVVKKFDLTIEDFPHKKSGYINYLLNKIRNREYEPGIRARAAAEDIINMTIKSSKPVIRHAAEGGLFDLICAAVNNYDRNFIKYNTALQLIKTIYVTGIFKDLLDKLKLYRDENKTLLMPDVNNILLSVISGDSSPFVYEKTGSYFKNFLIDEFQDTSTFQWRNFRPLIENSLSENNASIIVGDVKQSIYRWRSGNMNLLLEEVERDLALFESEISGKDLKENFRSCKEIIEFNNNFFSTASEITAGKASGLNGETITNAYKVVAQEQGRPKQGGYVNIKFIDYDRESETTTKEAALQNVIIEIKSLLEAGYRQKDILVLVNWNREGVEAAHALIDARLRVVSSDSLLLTNSPKIKLIINLFKYLNNINDEIARIEIIYNYLVYIKNENVNLNELFLDHRNNNRLFRKSMPPGVLESPEQIKLNNRYLGMPLYELTEEFIRKFELGNSVDSYLLRFLDTIKEYSDKNNSGLYGFLNWWEENKEKSTIVVPDEEDAIRVMTIHKAKGLESPVVFIPFANWNMGMDPGKDMIWVSSEIPPFNELPAYYVRAGSSLENSYFAADYKEEEMMTNLNNLNKLYVAFTRASERLYISVPQREGDKNHAGSLIRETLLGDPILTADYNGVTQSYESGTQKISGKTVQAEIHRDDWSKGLISSDISDKIVIKPLFENLSPERKKALDKQKNRGIVLHRALSMLGSADKTEITEVVEKLFILGLIQEDQKVIYKEEIEKILSNETVKSWFDKGTTVMSERDIIVPGSNLLITDKITLRPDRVIIKGKNALVIDYKAGRRNKEHEIQIRRYAEEISKMGFKKVQMSLFYINEMKIVTLT